MDSIKILAAAKYTPDFAVTNDDLTKLVDTSDEWIASRTGIRNRYISTGENTSDLCTKAALEILRKANVSPEQIDVIIVATITHDYMTPSTACLVQRNICANNAFAFDIGAACSGFVFGFSIGAKWAAMGKTVLVMGGETLSKITDWTDRTTCVLFGDGAGGVLITRDDSGKSGILAEDLHSDGSRAEAIMGVDFPVNNAFYQGKVEKPYVTMQGREVMDFAMKEVPKSINYVLTQANVDLSEIKLIIPHQANARIVEAIAKKLKTNYEHFYVNIDQYGNTSSATIPIALADLFDQGILNAGTGDKIILAGFGGGLTWGSILLIL